MVGVTGEEVINTPEIDSQAVKEAVVEAPPAPLKIEQPTEEEVLEERTEKEETPRANRDNEDTTKYGFGAGMRMYAKSLALAEQQEKSAEEIVPTAPKAEEPKTDEPKVEASKIEEPKVEEPKVEEPKVEEPKVEEPKVEAPEQEAKAKEAVVEEPAVKAETAVEAAPTKMASTPACGNIFQQIKDAIGEFFRKTEDVVDEAHERVCSRSAPCASTAMNGDAETMDEMVDEDEAEETAESPVEEPKEEPKAEEVEAA